MTVPPQAITAAAEAIERKLLREFPPDGCMTWLDADEELARAALEAAAPFLAEDGWDAARDRATETNQARRDERERCAQLAQRVGAAYPQHRPGLSSFADLLRKEARP